MNLNTLRALGFDESKHIPFTRQYRVRCSSCEVLVVCGTATHEHGCPNQTFECRGCDAAVAFRNSYCPDCQ